MKEWTGDNTGEFTVMTREQVRAFDAWATGRMGIPGVVLMENAARGCTEVIEKMFAGLIGQGVCVFCGVGNNGGDGFAIARHLYNRRVAVKLAVCADLAKIKGDAKVNYDICRTMGLPIETLDSTAANLGRAVRNAVGSCGLVVDALLGTGLQGELSDALVQTISVLNACGRPIVAVDIPSGLDCDEGLPLPVCIEAAATVTFVAVKKGLIASPQSRRTAGRIFVADIGITPRSITASDFWSAAYRNRSDT
ncbi:MAG: NAD(P)H-hydrate epimerase [Planctomycetales bacterium]|nr:NAD(P)H-hydrate epimerase [Planctomycetales bacterium]